MSEIYQPYPCRSVSLTCSEADQRWFQLGFCPQCLSRLPVECTYPPEGVDPESEICVYCGVAWVE